MVQRLMQFVVGAMAALFMTGAAQSATLVKPVSPGTSASGGLVLPTSGTYFITLTSTVAVSGMIQGFAEKHYNTYDSNGSYTGGNDIDYFDWYELEDVTSFQFFFQIPRNYTIYFPGGKEVGYYNNGAAAFNLFSSESGTVTLTVQRVGEVPEPATWALLIVGFGVTGTALRRRRSVPALA